MSLFAQHTSGGAFIKPSDLDGQLIVIANVARDWTREYDQLRQGEVEIATFDCAVVGGPEGWQTVRCNYNGINNKLGNIRGGQGMTLGRIGKVKTNAGFDAWALGAFTPEDEQLAGAWLQANPAPSPFAAQSAPPTPAPAAAPAPQPVAVAPAPVPVAAAPAPTPAPAPPQYTPEQLQAMLAQLQGGQQ